MKRAWLREEVEHAVRELVQGFDASGSSYAALCDKDKIMALAAAAHALILQVQEYASPATDQTMALTTAEDFISEARKLLIKIRFELLPADAANLLDRIVLAADRIDAINELEMKSAAANSLAALPVQGRC